MVVESPPFVDDQNPRSLALDVVVDREEALEFGPFVFIFDDPGFDFGAADAAQTEDRERGEEVVFHDGGIPDEVRTRAILPASVEFRIGQGR